MKWLYALVLCGVVFAEEPLENPGQDLFEGDVILNEEQKMAVALGLDIDNPFGRGANRGRQWPGGVMPYVIHPNLARDRRAMWAIKEGMELWWKRSCIRFKKRTNERAYVNFVPGSGCSSYVGRQGSPQNIYLARGCWTKGIVSHEVGHALGFWHEQSRPDRDRYVTIFWNNIQERAKGNFNKHGSNIINSLGSPYDYGSIMHYGSKDFSKNGKPTILPKRKGARIGQRNGPSRTDLHQMNLLYRGICRG